MPRRARATSARTPGQRLSAPSGSPGQHAAQFPQVAFVDQRGEFAQAELETVGGRRPVSDT
ncbi:hypothetical protein CH341_05895 [Rhodoplanes roseus]|uniref:Uncharacterized protein n=1 Tax=Rhodoplanes roseus TaxID=29409 RepID=A0A327L3X2_9BRAD|nr:hypothetical protein CH341_05895 [Rhodoplanes roseus]